MEVDLYQSFHPQCGAIARRVARDISIVDRDKKRRLSGTRALSVGKQVALQQMHHSSSASAASRDVPLAVSNVPQKGEMLKFSSSPSLLTGKSLLQPRCHPENSVSQEAAPMFSESRRPALEDLISAARHKMRELPRKDSDARAGLCEQGRSSSRVELPPATQHLADCVRRQSRPLTGASPAPALSTRERVKEKSSAWSLQEESQRLSQELARLGKPPEPMKWASEEIENKWLRREATYELFKALVSSGCKQDTRANLMPYEGSTRTPTPAQSSICTAGLACEHDALTNLLGKDISCTRY